MVTAGVSREVVKKLIDRLDRIGTPISDEDRDRIMQAIDGWDPDSFMKTLAVPEP